MKEFVIYFILIFYTWSKIFYMSNRILIIIKFLFYILYRTFKKLKDYLQIN